VRILRLARFAARFADFTVADETMALMGEMVESGEVDALVPERVWQELAKGLMEGRPSRMFEVLRACNALKKILPEVDRLFGVPQPPQHHPEVDTGVHVMLVLDYAAARGFPLPVRFAALTHDLGKGTTPKDMLPRHIGHEERGVGLVRELCKRLRVPNDCRDLGVVTAHYHGKAYRALEMRPDTVVQLLHDTDALRQPERFTAFLQACESDLRGRPGYETRAFPEADYLKRALAAAQAVDAGAIARSLEQPEKIRDAVFRARVAAVAQLPRS
jgi:tRNA nucleotidyltransferase (CCA-adding enzyme)